MFPPPPWEVRKKKFHTATFPIGDRTQVHGLSQFHREIDVRILSVDVPRGVAEQSDVKVALRRHTFSHILHASCRHPRALTVTSAAYEIFANAVYDPLVQYLIYLIGGPVSFESGSQFLAIKLIVD